MSTPAATIHVIATVKSKPDQAEAMREELVSLVEQTRKENGCISYHLFEDPKVAGSFYTKEEWANQAALDAHMIPAKAAIEKAAPLLAAAPIITPMKLVI